LGDKNISLDDGQTLPKSGNNLPRKQKNYQSVTKMKYQKTKVPELPYLGVF
tara:strand:- start:667 stop:819 length:153 start_codon:yes stop_codon:yes gene_type:complete